MMLLSKRLQTSCILLFPRRNNAYQAKFRSSQPWGSSRSFILFSLMIYTIEWQLNAGISELWVNEELTALFLIITHLLMSSKALHLESRSERASGLARGDTWTVVANDVSFCCCCCILERTVGKAKSFSNCFPPPPLFLKHALLLLLLIQHQQLKQLNRAS